ncbi:MAG TPA: tetratricopeptide repeat protein [Thermoanaerobaculia bacterium]|nr:tetratricopeptide repeat protein [Thermoanaerobaculia bacterium]
MPLTAAAAGPRQRAKPSSAAYEAYLRGIYFLRQHRSAEATASLQDAVLLDPTFAEAYAGLARALDSVEKPLCADMALIDTAARRALALDPDLAEAHFALAHSLFHCHFDWQEAGREFQRALALDPGNADTYHQYAFYLASLGRHGEAISAASQARELDPASMLVGSDFAYFFYVGRRYDEAVQQARRALELISISPEDPGVTRFYRFWTLWVLFRSASALGDEETAAEAGRGLMEFYGEGQEAKQVRSLEDFLRWQESWLLRRVRTQPVPAYFFAIASVDSSHYRRALDALEEDCRTRRSFMLLFTGVEPGLDPLRGDPRFARILDCLKLPAEAPVRRAVLTGRAAAPHEE